ncbi:MAG: hypothetical protein ABIS11_03790 [Candidatus Dojkabacteria bacterium]
MINIPLERKLDVMDIPNLIGLRFYPFYAYRLRMGLKIINGNESGLKLEDAVKAKLDAGIILDAEYIRFFELLNIYRDLESKGDQIPSMESNKQEQELNQLVEILDTITEEDTELLFRIISSLEG